MNAQRSKKKRSNKKPVQQRTVAKRPAAAASGNTALVRRVAKLEKELKALKSPPRGARAFTLATKDAIGGPSVMGLEAAAGALTNVGFEKLDGSPGLVRVELKGHGDIIANGASQGSLKNVRVGTWIVVWVHVSGNPGQSAKIKVTGAVENQITVTLVDSGQRSEPRNLLVTG